MEVYKRNDFLHRYYSEKSFLTDISGKTKEKILYNICGIVMEEREVPEDFYELVLAREELGTTDYGNLAALPHPLKTVTRESYVYVAVLDKPVAWGRRVSLFQCNKDRKELSFYMVFGKTKQLISSLNKGQECFARIDTFNENGIKVQNKSEYLFCTFSDKFAIINSYMLPCVICTQFWDLLLFE